MKKNILFKGAILSSLLFSVVFLSACTRAQDPTVNNMNEGNVNTNVEANASSININDGIYDVKEEESVLTWRGEKVIGDYHTGDIKLIDGSFTFSDNRIITGDFEIDMTSITDSDGSVMLENHLKSDDFFSVEAFPRASLIIIDSEVVSSTPNNLALNVVGLLTIKGIENEIEFMANVSSLGEELLIESDINFDRALYDVRFGSGSFFDNLGDNMIKDEVLMTVNILASL